MLLFAITDFGYNENVIYSIVPFPMAADKNIEVILIIDKGHILQTFGSKSEFTEAFHRGQCSAIDRGAQLYTLSGKPVKVSVEGMLE